MKYVLQYNEGGWVALDQSTGGYPYKVLDLWRAKTWDEPEQAFAYQESFKDTIAPVAVSVSFSIGHNNVNKPMPPEDCQHKCNTSHQPNFGPEAKHYLDCPVMKTVLNKGEK